MSENIKVDLWNQQAIFN